MMRGGLWAALFLVVACGESTANQGTSAPPSVATTSASSSASTREPTSDNALPHGWYEVVESAHPDLSIRGAGFRFSESSYEIVTGNGDADRRSVTWQRTATGWHAASERMPFDLRVVSATELVLNADGHDMRLRRAPAERMAWLERRVAPVSEPNEVCAQWLQCCREAMPLVGAQCDEASEMGDRTARTCTNGLNGMRQVLAASHVAVPASCAEH